ncbi:hypothetical protein OSG_eHP4_00180 [environmental Halophage eHP-4]|nr:hypothetical protein OSG_eHP4_00180 [environmental Halophage eHP-4]
MSDYELHGEENTVGLNGENTIGVVACQHLCENQTRRGYYTPETLVEWAEAVADAYEEEACVEIIFTPGEPMIATRETDKETRIGIGIAPRIFPSEETNE